MQQIGEGERFPDLRLEAVGGPVRLREHWRRSPLIVAFMRHFGCSFCREHLTTLAAADERVRAAGGRTVAIFQYDAAMTQSFCDSRSIPFDCLGDPERAAYDRIGLGSGTLRQLMGWQVIKRGRAAYRAGGGQGGSEGGSIALMPGSFVLDRDGGIVLAHYNRNAADNPDVELLIEAVAAATTAGPQPPG